MKVLKATLTQKKAIEGTYAKGVSIQFIQDANNNWVVNENVLDDENFIEIHKQLDVLPKIEYSPKIIAI